MSYEGYYQILCRNGHSSGCDCYDEPAFEEENLQHGDEIWRCPICQELAAWWNLTNVTNGSYCECNTEYKDRSEGCEHCDRGRIDGYIDLEDDIPVQMCTCKECGATHVATVGTKKIPKTGGHLVNLKR